MLKKVMILLIIILISGCLNDSEKKLYLSYNLKIINNSNYSGNGYYEIISNDNIPKKINITIIQNDNMDIVISEKHTPQKIHIKLSIENLPLYETNITNPKEGLYHIYIESDKIYPYYT